MQQLQDWLRTHASPTFALPALHPTPPQISWAPGGVSPGGFAPTTLPGGVRLDASNALFGGPLRNRLASSLPGSPTVNGVPCLTITRPYTSRGNQYNASSTSELRFKTNASRIELSGVTSDFSYVVLTLLVDGQLVPPTTLTASRGGGGWVAGTVVIDFGTPVLRDIWIDTQLFMGYVTVDANDTVLAADDHDEPQLSAIGDSYLQTRSASFCNGGAIALEIGARLGIRNVATDAIGGTGYYNTNGGLGNLNDRLPAHGGDNSILYLVMAGINDYGDTFGWPTRAQYEQSVIGYIANLRLAQPKALIVVTAPFSPIPPMSDSTYVAHPATNTSGLGDFLWTAQLHKTAIQQIAGPWVYIDVLMGGGWLNSAGATGDATDLQWFTGGTPGSGTDVMHRPGNTLGGGGGGYDGIASVPVVSGGLYTQAPNITATGGSGSGVQLASAIDSTGKLTEIRVVQDGFGYSAGAGLPTIHIDPTFETTPAVLGTPVLTVGVNQTGQYPLPSFAPPGATDLNNVLRLLQSDTIHPSGVGVEYLAKRLAQNIYQAVMAL